MSWPLAIIKQVACQLRPDWHRLCWNHPDNRENVMTTLCLCDLNEHDLSVLSELAAPASCGAPADWPGMGNQQDRQPSHVVQDARYTSRDPAICTAAMPTVRPATA